MFTSQWITHPATMLSENKIYLFRKTFFLKESLTEAILNISAEARYKLFINGERVAFGPCRPSAEEKYYDTLDVAKYLYEGENELLCQVLQLSDDRDMLHTAYVHGVRRSGNMLLAVELTCGETVIRTDESWECAVSPNVEMTIRNFWLRSAMFEENVRSGEPEWISAKTLVAVDFLREKPYPWGVVNPMFVIPRPIPMMYQKQVAFADMGDGFYIADELTIGFPTLRLTGHGTVRITYAESFGQGKEKKDRLDRSLSFSGAYDEITVDGDFTYEPFWIRCGRIIKIELDNTVALKEFTFTEIGYPLTYPDNCDFGNERDNRLWKISVTTLMRCMQESYMDCPYHEQLQYAMDTSLQMLYNYQLTDDDALARKAIHDFRLSQRADGLLESRYPSMRPQFIPSFSLYYIFMVSEHYKRFGDKALVRENLRAMDGVLEWFENCVDETGLIRHSMYWDFIDWATTWDKTAGEPVVGEDCHIAIASAMYVAVLKMAAELVELCGRVSTAEEYRSRANAVTEAIEKHCWCEERGLYSDDTKGQYFSQQMQTWCVLSGIADETRAHRIIENALPLDTKCTYAYAYFWFRALEQVGLYEETEPMMERLRGLLDLNCSTIPETPDAPRSECHAWGAIAIYEFAAVVLGVRTVSVAEKKLRIAPRIDGRDHAKGDVTTGCGKVLVDWKVENGVFTITVDSPAGVNKEIVLPNGEVRATTDASVTVQINLVV